MNIPSNLKYTKSDEWVDLESGKMGLTDYAQDQLSDIVFVEALVDADDDIAVGDGISEVESVKASAEVYAPAGGKVVAINEDLGDAPEVINSDPYGAGWLVQVEVSSQSDELMDAAAYEKYCADRD
ncbi:MAG: glycine cleavage system protein GcvH [Anaerolineae bacterium]|jgi:glycine cleavage system H protein|nr:glycine cleavage system protein GcvH [Anaerolineae bacterium]MBT7075322.1 glycine cleavage system protein GcvH [Anaerolineae bacterium]MBT7783919.1 glycine cleavage system protein GcvH [Anaerolineae bacterium]